jgi:hypothetical protein
MSPFLNTRAGAISVSFFKKEKDGKEYASCCIQRSYKDKNGEWKRESINLFPDDLPTFASLCLGSHYEYCKTTQKPVEKDPFEF